MTTIPSGLVFDIKEFAVHDGPGIRTTVFLKGCPLRCAWCHNPEGLAAEAQTMASEHGTRTAGQFYRADDLATLLNRQADLLRHGEGGVTFSGGEPLLQADFLRAVLERLDGLHVVLDTCAHADPSVFRDIIGRVDLVYLDVKLMDPREHRRYTSVDNDLILHNVKHLGNSGCPCVVRIPLVPGVTDRTENLAAIARLTRRLKGLAGVDLLPYNRAAGAKYPGCGLEFRPTWCEEQKVNADVSLFADLQVPVKVRR